MNKVHKSIIALAFLISCALFATSFVLAQERNGGNAVLCVGTAVVAREQSIGTAASSYSQAMANAYTLRAEALVQAYAQPGADAKTIRASVKSAWSTFDASAKSARTDWKRARNSAWGTFKASARACKTTEAISDADHSVQEL